MELKEMVATTFDRMWDTLDRSLEGVSDEEFARRPNPHSNSIGWIAWHMGRVVDRWLHGPAGPGPELWEQGWAEKLGLPADPGYSGGGMTPEQVDQFETPKVEQVKAYIGAVREDARRYLDALPPADFDREFESWFGRKMTIGQMFCHLFCELNQHAGQVAYLKGYCQGYQGRR